MSAKEHIIPPSKTKKKRFIKIVFIALAAVLILVGGSLSLLRSYVRPPMIPEAMATVTPTATPPATDASQITAEPGAEMPRLNPTEGWERRPYFFTFLIFGLDETMNADSIMVAAYDGVAQQAYIISIPRDTQVDVDRWLRKIVEAYPSGLARGEHADGVENLMQEVQGLMASDQIFISV